MTSSPVDYYPDTREMELRCTFKRDDCRYLKNRELSNDDDGSENVAKKINLPHFKCYRVYLALLNLQNLSNVDDFSWR